MKHMDRDITQLEDLFQKLEKYSEKYHVDLFLSVSKDRAEIPVFMEKYLID